MIALPEAVYSTGAFVGCDAPVHELTTHSGDKEHGSAGMRIQVIFDPGCPWCYIGKRQLELALALRSVIDARLGWWPFLLNPDLPPEGLDRATHMICKFGNEARVGRIHTAIADVGQSVGINFAFERIRRTPNTVNAHRLIRFAGLYGRANQMAESSILQLFRAGTRYRR